MVESPDELPEWVRKFVDDDGSGPYVSINSEFIAACVNEESCYGQPLAYEHWEAESVWPDRDEAEAWCEAKSHRFTFGWRVYAVCAEGALARILRKQDGE